MLVNFPVSKQTKHAACSIFVQAHNKSISSLIMLSEGTLLSGGEKDRKIIAWDSLQNYKKITETKVRIYR